MQTLTAPTDASAAAEDVGNIVSLEHVNTQVPDQSIATLFYIVGLGFTRDPYMNVGLTNMWINIGRHQCTYRQARPQRLRGTIGLVMRDLSGLKQRLTEIVSPLSDTQFGYIQGKDAFPGTF